MRRLFVILTAATVAGSAAAQDANYWDTQYGTKGGMLGGLVVGTPSDLSATFYNPGWIALDPGGTFLLTTQAVEAYRVSLDGGPGADRDIESTTASVSPGYLAGRFTIDPGREWDWAYSYLKKVQFNYEAQGVEFDAGPLPPVAGDWFSGETFRKAHSDEYWYGVTAARELKNRTAIGFSPYVIYRSVYSRLQAAAQASDDQGNFAQTYMADQYRFYHVRALMKIGLAVDRTAWKAGLTLTTPSLGIMGSGETMSHATSSGADFDGDGAIDPPYVVSDHQEGLSTSWKSPLSLAAGLTWKPGDTGVHLTAEWFDAIGTLGAMEPEPFTDQTTGETLQATLNYTAKRVFNYGVGFEHDFEGNVSVYGAFRSDYSSSPGDDSDTLSLTAWNLWHVSGGAAFQFLNMEFNAGLQYSWGSRDAERFINFNPEGDDDVLLKPGTFRIKYQRIKALIGFNLPALGVTTP